MSDIVVRSDILYQSSTRVRQRSQLSFELLSDPYFIIVMCHPCSGDGLAGNYSVPRRRAAHLYIGRDGNLVQCLPFNRRSDACGAGEFKGFSDLRSVSIFLSLENDGRLVQLADGSWRSLLGRSVNDDEVIWVHHREEEDHAATGWHTFDPVQIDVAMQVVDSLLNRYDISEVLGHDQVAWPREQAPGPAFPIQLLC